MNKLDTSSLEKALDSLRRSIDISKKYLLDPSTPADLRQTLQAGVIQHFEFCYELSWKMLKRQIEKESPVSSAVDAFSFQELIRDGAERQLIIHAENWLIYRHQRNITSHTYQEEKAESVYQTAIEFYPDAVELLKAIKARNS